MSPLIALLVYQPFYIQRDNLNSTFDKQLLIKKQETNLEVLFFHAWDSCVSPISPYSCAIQQKADTSVCCASDVPLGYNSCAVSSYAGNPAPSLHCVHMHEHCESDRQLSFLKLSTHDCRVLISLCVSGEWPFHCWIINLSLSECPASRSTAGRDIPPHSSSGKRRELKGSLMSVSIPSCSQDCFIAYGGLGEDLDLRV